jgi:hypothetical protein
MTYDPWDAAGNPPERQTTSRWFGRLFLDVWACALIKGQGKVPFDDQVHDASQRLTAVQMEVQPLSDYDVTFTLERDLIAEFGAWPKVTLPSIKALGVDLRTLNKKWVAVEFKPTGRTYTGRDGEEKQETTFVVMGVYDTEAECRAAYQAFNADEPPFAVDEEDTKARATAAMFIGPLWAQAGQDKTKMADLLGKTPIVSEFFTIDSPEVVAVIGGD